MKLVGYVFLSALLFFTLPAALAQPPPPREDNQFWHETQFIKSLRKDKDLVVIAVLRAGRDFARPVDERLGAGLAFKPSKYLTIMPTYVYVDQQPFAGRRIKEHRLIFNATMKFKVGELTFTDRNLLERRVRHTSRDFTVYRNRLQLDYPARIGTFKFKPFLADEIWYSTQSGPQGRQGWFRNRISAGIIKQLGERFNAEVFYLRQTDGISLPGDVHAVGTLLRVYFP
jgi:Protein of unknown function (DUF2490)